MCNINKLRDSGDWRHWEYDVAGTRKACRPLCNLILEGSLQSTLEDDEADGCFFRGHPRVSASTPRMVGVAIICLLHCLPAPLQSVTGPPILFERATESSHASEDAGDLGRFDA